MAGKKQKSQQTMVDVQNDIADASGLRPMDVKRCLVALREVAVESLITSNKFKIDKFTVFRLKQTNARSAGVRNVFGKLTAVQAKPAGQKIVATIAKPFHDVVNVME